MRKTGADIRTGAAILCLLYGTPGRYARTPESKDRVKTS